MRPIHLSIEDYPYQNPFTETRRKVLQVLHGSKIPLSVTETSDACGIPIGTLSQEIRVLERMGILKSRRDGRAKLVELVGWPIIVG